MPNHTYVPFWSLLLCLKGSHQWFPALLRQGHHFLRNLSPTWKNVNKPWSCPNLVLNFGPDIDECRRHYPINCSVGSIEFGPLHLPGHILERIAMHFSGSQHACAGNLLMNNWKNVKNTNQAEKLGDAENKKSDTTQIKCRQLLWKHGLIEKTPWCRQARLGYHCLGPNHRLEMNNPPIISQQMGFV